jgi:carbon starvation protein
MHAMPVMLGVLAILAVAYRYYSAFLAAKVAALDDSRKTPAHRFSDGQNFDPTNRWVLFGHHFAAISGAGPLIGPVLAIQFGYMPGLVWLVVGVCLAGAVQDMMVLAASTRRDGLSLAGIARAEIGRPAGIAAAIAILYIVIIALAGLGIVVVKALGGEEVAMKTGTVLVYPPGSEFRKTMYPDTRPTIYSIPPEATYQFGDGQEHTMVIHEAFQLSVPRGSRLTANPKGSGWILPENTKRLVPGSSWGTFTIACTIPIALLVGWYMYRFRKGKVLEASLLGAALVLGVTFAGALVPGSPLEQAFSLSREQTVFALALYGFVAAVLPVWLLLCPRDYLSTFLKIGTILLLVVGVLIANPKLEAPPVSPHFASGGGPNLDGPIFPYVFICIMCGAISGFHSLVSSGTTPKMIDRESDVRMIGYGAMLMEGLVGVVALIAAAALPNTMYYGINIDLSRRPDFLAKNPEFAKFLQASEIEPHGDPANAQPKNPLVAMEEDVQESLHGRTGGAVTLAVGMARIFSDAIPNMRWLIKYWYHFAIMFEALFILTTIDAGTRIARFLVQEFLGKLSAPLGDLNWLPASLLATGLVVFGWGYFIYTGNVETIWPMFGMANQLLAVIALAVVTSVIINSGRGRYAPVTLLPMLFVVTTTSTTAYREITGKFWKMTSDPAFAVRGWLNIGLTMMVLACVVVIVVSAAARWIAPGAGDAGSP